MMRALRAEWLKASKERCASGHGHMRSVAILAIAGTLTAADDRSSLRAGQWSVRYEVVDVSSDLLPRPQIFIGYRWGGENCLTPDAPSASVVLEAGPHHCEIVSFSAQEGRVLATRTCRGGHAIPGIGTETIVASVQDDRFVGTSDVTLISYGGAVSHIRSVIVGERTGECS
jgi:hypothetical protein